MNYKTKQREILLNVLKENSKTSYSAKELFELVNENISKATLYRELSFFDNCNEVSKYYNQANNCYEYQYVGDNSNCSNHLHLKCLCCGKIIHLNGIINTRLRQNEEQFAVDFSNSIIMGKCKECVGK